MHTLFVLMMKPIQERSPVIILSARFRFSFGKTVISRAKSPAHCLQAQCKFAFLIFTCLFFIVSILTNEGNESSPKSCFNNPVVIFPSHLVKSPFTICLKPIFNKYLYHFIILESPCLERQRQAVQKGAWPFIVKRNQQI